MENVDLDDIEIVVKDISANDGILLCNWNSLIVGTPVYCDSCPYDVIDRTTCTHSNKWELEALK